MELQVTTQVLLYAFLIAVVIGAVANRTNFCTMGAVSDWVNMGKTGRLWAWFTAIAVAMLGTQWLEYAGTVGLSNTLPPYRTAQFAWLRYILGGFLFGIGMTLAGGCGNKTLVNIGGGNLKSLLVMFVAGIFAYLMTKTRFYEVLFHSWINATTVNLADFGLADQGVGSILGKLFGLEDSAVLARALAILIAIVLLVMAFRSKSFRTHGNNIVSGIVIGLAVVAGWYVTGGALGQQAIEAAEWMDNRPLGVGVQSYTFINPLGETLAYVANPQNLLLITFGVVAVAGVILGSMIAALIARKFQLVWFKARGDFFKHLGGAVLMGIGGVLAMGCTIGQGISGVSTLALGSFLVLVSIIFGSALTMKIQYYQMCYEDEASFTAALLSSLVDMHVLPKGMRKLDAP